MDVDSIQKKIKILSFTTTKAIMMKLTTDIYLNKYGWSGPTAFKSGDCRARFS